MLARRLGVLIVACLGSMPAARAGLAPLARQGKHASLDRQTRLELLEDSLVLHVRPEYGEWVETVRLRNPGPACKVWLGLPLADRPENGPQDVSVRWLEGAASRPAPALAAVPARETPGVERWLAFQLALEAGESLGLEVRAWQRHGVEERYGVWRLVQQEALWTAAAWASEPTRLSRRVELGPGVFYVGTEPEARAEEPAGGAGEGDWERLPRLLAQDGQRPDPEAPFKVFFWVRDGARSPCPGRPWDALDGNAESRWAPAGCPAGPVSLEVLSFCRGIGLLEPDCTGAPNPVQVAMALAQSPDAKADRPFQVEGWFGPHKAWSQGGKLNQPLWLLRTEPVTVLRFVFPAGVPEGGAEVTLLRVDLARSSPGAERALARGPRPRTEKACSFRMRLANPVWFRHVTLKLRPQVEPRDWMVEIDCAEGRGRELLFEPETHEHHSGEQIREIVSDDLYQQWKAEIEKSEREGDAGHEHGEEFRRKHPDRIELPADPTCKTWLISLTTALPFCQMGPRTPETPVVELGF